MSPPSNRTWVAEWQKPEHLPNALADLKQFILTDTPPMSGCADCNGRGYTQKPKVDGGLGFDGVTCHCAKYAEHMTKAIRAFHASGFVAADFRRYDFETYDTTRGDATIAEVIKYAISSPVEEFKGTWLYLWGRPGRGKTYRAALTGLLAIAAGKNVYYTNVPDLMDALRPNETSPDEKRLVMEQCTESDLLILDDVGQEKPSEWVTERLYLIINGRYRRNRKTILTSNYDLDQLESKLKHEAIISRLMEMCVCIHLEGSDRREDL